MLPCCACMASTAGQHQPFLSFVCCRLKVTKQQCVDVWQASQVSRPGPSQGGTSTLNCNCLNDLALSPKACAAALQ